MNSPYPIGLGAGLVSAVLFASVAAGNTPAMLLLYLTPLPGFLAGLGWGWISAALAAASGTVVVGAALGFATAVSYALSLGLPAAILSYLALLSREAPQLQPAGLGQPQPVTEWYPPGRLLAWTAFGGGVLSTIFVATVANDLEAYLASVKDLLRHLLLSRADVQMTQDEIDRFAAIVAHLSPAIIATTWTGVTVFNMWAAGRIVDYSGRALRPWPDLANMRFPNMMAIGLVVSLLASLVPGMPGFIASGFLAAFLVAYFLLGLVVLHVVTRDLPRRGLFLVMIYFSIFIFGWVAILVAILGLADPIFQLRERAQNRTRPPTFGDD